MRPRRDVAPYTASANIGVNASLSIAKLYKRIRMVNPSYKPVTCYQARVKNKRALRRSKPGIVR